MDQPDRATPERSFDEDEFPDMDTAHDDDIDAYDVDDDTYDLDDDDPSEGALHRMRAKHDPAGRGYSSGRSLPHDWTDFDYGGGSDAFDSPWR